MAYTVVSGIITDPNGVLYVNAQITADFVPSPTATQIPTLGNATATFPLTILGIRCDSFAAFSMTLADNNAVTDGHTGGQASQWKFNVISQDGKTAFSYTTTITGASQDISAGLKAAAATFQVTNITGITAGTTGNIAKYATATTISDGGIAATNIPTLNGTNAFTAAETHAALESFAGGISADGTHTLTLPAATDTLTGKATVDTLTNKTISGGTLTGTISGSPTLTGLPSFTGGIAGLGRTVSTFNANGTTSSTSYVTFYALSAITTRGGSVIVSFTVPATATTQQGQFTISADGVDGNVLAVVQTTGTADVSITVSAVFSPGAGSHTYILRGKVSTGGTLATNCASVANGCGWAIELSQ